MRSSCGSPGFADVSSNVTVTVGSAFELSLEARGSGARYERHGDSGLDSARGGAQPDCRHGLSIGSAGAAVERPEFPRSGPADSRSLADQHRQHAIVCGDVCRSGSGDIGGQSAQLLQQFHRGRTVGQRRCGWIERHSVLCRCGRSVPGCDLRRAGRARTRAWRIRQRRHQERHERYAWRRLRIFPR